MNSPYALKRKSREGPVQLGSGVRDAKWSSLCGWDAAQAKDRSDSGARSMPDPDIAAERVYPFVLTFLR